MAIDPLAEKLISFNDAAAYLPAASRPAYATWWRWWRNGVRGVRLETVVVGGRRYTSAEAVARFIAATTEAAGTIIESVAASTQTSETARRLARQVLVEAGIADCPAVGATLQCDVSGVGSKISRHRSRVGADTKSSGA